MKPRQDPAICFLDGFVDSSQSTWRTAVRCLPFAIGRHPDADMVLTSTNVSGRHAEIRKRGPDLLLCDLESTNGTFVNGNRITGCTPMTAGDSLHFGDQEFVLVFPQSPSWANFEAVVPPTAQLLTAELPSTIFEQERLLQDLIQTRSVTSFFQPIIDLQSGRTIGFEVLGRGLVNGELLGPADLFRTAELCGLEIELARLFRRSGFEEARALPDDTLLFFNTHPSELVSPSDFLDHLAELRRRHPTPQLILEIHEQAVPGDLALQALRTGLRRLGVDIGLDDFGTGQARLKELVEVEPRFVKFDITWIKNIDRVSPRRRDMIGKLVQLITDMGMEPLAEGIERPEEATVCQSLGFKLAQGYHFGYPQPAAHFI